MILTCICSLAAILVLPTSVKSQNDLKSFSWTNCGQDDPVVLENLIIQPDPILVPGVITASAKVSNLVNINSLTKATIKFEKKMGSGWYTVPCVSGWGTCKYDDVCGHLAETIPDTLPCPPALMENNIGCHCPFNFGKYEVREGKFDVNIKLPPSLLQGDYHLTATLVGENRQLACYEFWFTVRSPQQNNPTHQRE